MFSEAELAIVRRAYAKQVLAIPSIADARLEAAFAEVPREHFLGRGPWQLLGWEGYVPTPSADPVYLYSNCLVGIVPERKINNGEPALHARLIGKAAPQPGEHVVHIGAGVGYYTAIMAHMVGALGKVSAIEYDGELAKRAADNLRGAANVTVIQGDGTAIALEPADVVYVNAGATRPHDVWLDALKDGGRLVLPLTSKKGFDYSGPLPIRQRGVVFLITRQRGDFSAEAISGVAIFPCEGGRDDVSEAALAAALEGGGLEKVARLYRHEQVPAEQCWLKAPGSILAFE